MNSKIMAGKTPSKIQIRSDIYFAALNYLTRAVIEGKGDGDIFVALHGEDVANHLYMGGYFNPWRN